MFHVPLSHDTTARKHNLYTKCACVCACNRHLVEHFGESEADLGILVIAHTDGVAQPNLQHRQSNTQRAEKKMEKKTAAAVVLRERERVCVCV